MEDKYMITTYDNPYNPMEDYDKWLDFDMLHGYNSQSRGARLLKLKPGMSDAEEQIAFNKAVDRLIEIDPLCIYTKIVVKNV